MENYFRDFKKEKISKEEDCLLLSEIEHFLNKENAIDIDENEGDYFDEINEMIKKLILLLNNNKQEMPWKYSNWNYFYLNIYELMNIVYNFYNFLFINYFIYLKLYRNQKNMECTKAIPMSILIFYFLQF